MKILLINPPQTFFSKSKTAAASIPLGLMYIAGVLDKENRDVEILDALTADVPPQTENDGLRFGLPWEDIITRVRQSKPDIIGIAVPFSSQVDNAVKSAKIVRSLLPGSLIVAGGPHVSVRASEFLEEAPEVDIAVIGEGEYTMLEIVRHNLEHQQIGDINGIAYRKDGKVVKTPSREPINNLDELPLPAYHLVDMERYLKPKRIRYRESRFVREIPLITSRGCPYNCVFCSIHLHMGKKWRAHSAGYVLSHLEHVVRNYGVQHIHFEDDNLTLNIRRWEEILDGILDRSIKFTWDTPNGVRADRLTPDLLRKMKTSGCTGLTIGVESGDQRILDQVIDKHLKLDNVMKIAEMCRKARLKLSAFYVIGFPGEKKEDMERTVNFALMLKKKYGVDMELFLATPLWGTRLHRICQENSYLTEQLSPRNLSESVQYWGRSLIRTADFTPEEVKSIAAKAVRAHNKMRLLDYLQHPWLPLRLALTHPQDALRFIKTLLGR